MKKWIYGLYVELGHFLYRTSVSVKDFGERTRIDPLVWIGKKGTKFCGMFPAK